MPSTLSTLLDTAAARLDVQTTAAGPAGALPLTEDLLCEGPSGDLFGWTQDAGMGWTPSELGRREVLILSTSGGIRNPDGSPVALGYHTGHWEVGLLMKAAAEELRSLGCVPFAGFCTDPCDGRTQGTPGMMDSLPYRNDAAMVFRRLLRSLPTRKAVVGVATCDKGLPAMMMALAAMHDLPCVLIPGGVTLPPAEGEDAGKVQSIGARFAHGLITLQEAAEMGSAKLVVIRDRSLESWPGVWVWLPVYSSTSCHGRMPRVARPKNHILATEPRQCPTTRIRGTLRARVPVCPCGSGKKFKKCCLLRDGSYQAASSGAYSNAPVQITSFRVSSPVPLRSSRFEPRQFTTAFDDMSVVEQASGPEPLAPKDVPLLPVEIGVDYTHPEPLGVAEVSYIFPGDRTFLLENGDSVISDDLQPGMRIVLSDGVIGKVTAIRLYFEPPPPPTRLDNGRVLSRVIGTCKHRGDTVVDVTWPEYKATSTPEHPYYSVTRGMYVQAQELQVGEYLRTDDNLVTPVLDVSKPRHEELDLYSIEVEHFHNYFVGRSKGGAVLVHNGVETPCINLPAKGGKVLSQDQLDAYAKKYAAEVKANEPYQWADIAPGLSRRQVKYIREYAKEKGLVKVAPVNGSRVPDFTGHIYKTAEGKVLDNVQLPKDLWNVPKERQFRYLNNQLFGTSETPKGYTWHHTEQPGKMQLVEYGIHSATDHVGGESVGGWSTYRRPTKN
jgi:hypothetical protein